MLIEITYTFVITLKYVEKNKLFNNRLINQTKKQIRRKTLIRKAMIMAAGAGSRLDPLTKTTPKPMVPVANIPIMEIILKHLKGFGIKDVIANTHTLAEQIHSTYSGNNDLDVNFEYVYEDKLSGTAGGVKKCQHFLESEDSFLVISGDALTDVNIAQLVESHEKSNAIATMALREVPWEEVKHFGVVVTDNNAKVVEFQEKPPLDEAKSNLVNTGIYVFKKEIFDYIPADTFFDFAKNVFPALFENNEVINTHVLKEYWNDIGTLNQYKLSSFDIFNEQLTIKPDYTKFKTGWTADSAKVDNNCCIEGTAVIGNNTVIEPNVQLNENNIIGNNCVIKSGAKLSNSIIWDNVVIEEDTVLEDCIIADGAVIKRDAKVASGEVIAQNAIIESQKV